MSVPRRAPIPALAALSTWLGLLAGGCNSPPSSLADFEWTRAFTGLDEAVLSACGGRGAAPLTAVGGASGRAAVFTFSGSEWRAEAVPESAGVLWWCWDDGAGATWAVGERGTVLRRTGATWSAVDTFGAVPDEVTLYGVWGASPSDIHAVGGSLENPALAMALAHYDGQTWRPVDVSALPDATLFKVWGSSAEDVFAVGASGTVVHYDGSQWSAHDSGSDARLTAVFGTGPADVYAVGGLGVGVVLHYDGATWRRFAEESEELAGVYAAPGQPLYVGGNRGLLVRYGLDPGGRPSAALARRAVPAGDLDVHALHRADGVLVAAASDLLGGALSGWRGSLLVDGSHAYDGPVIRLPGPDAGVPMDASADAGMDAAPMDAGGDAGVDAAQAPGPGETCGPNPDICAPGLECWLLADSAEYICTQPCSDPAECSAYGPGACCARPGFQTLETVCIPADRTECRP